MISADTSIKVTENDELVCPGHGRDGVLQIFIESVLHLVKVNHGGVECTDQSGEFLPEGREADDHQVIIDPFR